MRRLQRADEPAARVLVDAVLGSRWQARLGELVDVLDVLDVLDGPSGIGFLIDGAAGHGGQVMPAGLVTIAVEGGRAELRALAVDPARRRQGLGAALVEAAAGAAHDAGASTLWLVTTNDNLAALALYQRACFRLVSVRAGAVDEARRSLKPEIPVLGDHGIAMHDELVLERVLGPPT